MALAANEIALGADGLITLSSLKDRITGLYVNDATVTAKIFDVQGNRVDAGDADPAISLAYVSASNGKYQGTSPNDAALVEGEEYDVVVTAVKGAIILPIRQRRRAVWYDGT